MAAPVLDQDGMLSSVVWASLDLGWVSGFIERAGLPAATVLTVIDDTGIVQYRSIDPERYVGKPSIGRRSWRHCADGCLSVLRSRPGQRPRLKPVRRQPTKRRSKGSA
jgi:hypothetical protein